MRLFPIPVLLCAFLWSSTADAGWRREARRQVHQEQTYSPQVTQGAVTACGVGVQSGGSCSTNPSVVVPMMVQYAPAYSTSGCANGSCGASMGRRR